MPISPHPDAHSLAFGNALILGLYATPNGLPSQLIHIMDAIKIILK